MTILPLIPPVISYNTRHKLCAVHSFVLLLPLLCQRKMCVRLRFVCVARRRRHCRLWRRLEPTSAPTAARTARHGCVSLHSASSSSYTQRASVEQLIVCGRARTQVLYINATMPECGRFLYTYKHAKCVCVLVGSVCVCSVCWSPVYYVPHIARVIVARSTVRMLFYV